MKDRLIPRMMWGCLILFIGRVIGQVFVGIYGPAALPPWNEWYSGLLPYPLLLPAQAAVIVGMSIVAADASRRRIRLGPAGRRRLRRLGWAYAAAMILRYLLTMSLHPERRWAGGTIPIVFHLVLAAFVILWSSAGARRSPASR